MITDTFNPKYRLLGSTSRELWFLYLILKDHETHQFFYNIDSLVELTKHSTVTIINANKQLETNKIISRITSHRKTTTYTVKEKIKLSNGDTSFILVLETKTKDDSLVLETKTNRFQKLKPTVLETKTKNEEKSANKQSDNASLQDSDDVLSINLSIKDLSNKALSLPVPVQSTISEIVIEKNESESERNTDIEFDQEYYDYGKKLVEEFYPFYFINQQGGPMNSEKTKLIINIGLVSDGRQELVRRCMAGVASKLQNPANLLSWTWESIEKTLGWGDAEHGNNRNNRKR